MQTQVGHALYSYGLCSYGRYSYGLYSYGLYSYADTRRTRVARAVPQAANAAQANAAQARIAGSLSELPTMGVAVVHGPRPLSINPGPRLAGRSKAKKKTRAPHQRIYEKLYARAHTRTDKNSNSHHDDCMHGCACVRGERMHAYGGVVVSNGEAGDDGAEAAAIQSHVHTLPCRACMSAYIQVCPNTCRRTTRHTSSRIQLKAGL